MPETSALKFFTVAIHIHSVDKKNYLVIPPRRRSTAVSLETYPLFYTHPDDHTTRNTPFCHSSFNSWLMFRCLSRKISKITSLENFSTARKLLSQRHSMEPKLPQNNHATRRFNDCIIDILTQNKFLVKKGITRVYAIN